MIEEILEREVKKYEDEERRQEREKAEREAHEAKVISRIGPLNRNIRALMQHLFDSCIYSS